MAFNKRILPPRPGDPGSAHRLVDHDRRLQRMESTANVIGGGATITGALIETSDSDPRVYMQGSLGNLPGGQGFFITDTSGGVIVSLTGPNGLEIKPGINTYNAISWVDPAGGKGDIFAKATLTNANMLLNANSPDAQAGVQISMLAWNTGSGGATLEVTADSQIGTWTALILDDGGHASFPGPVGQFGSYGPSVKPASPGTATGTDATVINNIKGILQSYGMCA